MQLTFNQRRILPTSYKKKDESLGFNATVFTPVQYSIRFAAGIMPIEQMQAVMAQCAENAEEVEIDFIEGRNNFGSYMEIYSVRPVKSAPNAPITKPN